MIYFLSVGTAAFAFLLSRFSPNMINLLFKIVPFFIAALILSNWILSDFLVISLGGNAFGQWVSLGSSVVIGFIISLAVVQRERKTEMR